VLKILAYRFTGPKTQKKSGIVFYISAKNKRMKQYIGISLLVLALAACNSNGGGQEKKEKESYEAAKETLEQKEQKNPALFITVNSRDRHNLIGQTVVKGSLRSTAKVAVYKDIELELAFYSKTGALLEKDTETIYETLQPGGSVGFKSKYFAPKGTDSVAIAVLKAKSAAP
jgi:hypothetical protein